MMHYLFNESTTVISRNLYDLSDKNTVDQSSITKAFKGLETIILYFYQLYCLYPQKVFRLPLAEELIIREAIHELSQFEASAVNNDEKKDNGEKKRIEYHTKIALLHAALDQLASNNDSAIEGYKLILEKRPGWGAVYFFLLPLLEKLNLVDEYKKFREKMINNALVEENYHNHPSKDFLAKAYHEIFREEEIIQRKLALENKKKSELTSATSSNIRPSNMDEKEIQKENSDLGRSTFCKKEGGDNEGVFRLKLKI